MILKLSRSILACAVGACFFILAGFAIELFDPRTDYGGPPTTILQKFAELTEPELLIQIFKIIAETWLVLCCLLLPLQFVMQKFRLNHWLPFLIGGAALAFLPIWFEAEDMGDPLYSWLLIPGTINGALTCCVFWLIRRPDKDLPQSEAIA